jgi:LmbE family N-acetylglucosaminyl deacetylase
MRAAEFLRALRELPLRDLGAIGGNFVVVAPHPDDETLGCGGLVAAACARGYDVRILIVSDGTGSHPLSAEYPPARLRTVRAAETLQAAKSLGVDPAQVTFLGLPDRDVPSEGREAEKAAAAIIDLARRCRARAVMVTCGSDPHCDHQAAFAIARIATARLLDVALYAYPIWAWSLPPWTDIEEGPVDGFRFDISAQLAAKRCAIRAHHSQMGGLITDDPTGFRLDRAMLEHFERPFEYFVKVAT